MSHAPNADDPTTPGALTPRERLQLALDHAKDHAALLQQLIAQQSGGKSATGIGATLALFGAIGAAAIATGGSFGLTKWLVAPSVILLLAMKNFITPQRSQWNDGADPGWNPFHPFSSEEADGERLKEHYDEMTLEELLEYRRRDNHSLSGVLKAKAAANERGWTWFSAALVLLMVSFVVASITA
jgi:hypothetical protein